MQLNLKLKKEIKKKLTVIFNIKEDLNGLIDPSNIISNIAINIPAIKDM